jgi:Right handed beta helix region
MALTQNRTRAARTTATARTGRALAAAAATAVTAALMTAGAGAAFAATPAHQGAAPAHRGHGHGTAGPQLNCAASPHVCGFADATNSGVQPGTALTAVPGTRTSGPGWSWNASWGTLEVTGTGAVLSNLSVAGNIDVEASHVTLDNLQVTSTGSSWGIGLMNANNVLVEHCSISSPAASGPGRLQSGVKDVYGNTEGTVITDDNIWHAEDGVQLSAGLIQGTYIHDLAYNPGDHTDGIDSNAGDPKGFTITGNTILNPLDQTDDIALFENFGPQENVTITGNLMAGGDYSIYAGYNPGKAIPANIKITGNRFARTYYPNSGQYGPVADAAPGVNGNTWTANIWDNTGATINAS